MDLLYFWIGAVIIFLIIEMLTATFYGLSLAIASAVVALYVYFVHETSIDVIQWIMFAGVTFLTSFTLPRILIPGDGKVSPQGMDIYIGEKRKVKKAGDTFKIALDWVDYIAFGEDITLWDQVEVVGVKGAGFTVKKVQK